VVAFLPKRGIITTILTRPTQSARIAGRDRRIHHSKSLPLPLTGKGHFFCLEKILKNYYKNNKINKIRKISFRKQSPAQRNLSEPGARHTLPEHLHDQRVYP
jgi:hypothetical protein